MINSKNLGKVYGGRIYRGHTVVNSDLDVFDNKIQCTSDLHITCKQFYVMCSEFLLKEVGYWVAGTVFKWRVQ